MKLHTASETLSFIRELEEKAAQFYEELARRFPENKEDFLSFAKESRKYNKQIQMAYQSVISDALEGCFSFDLDPENYTFESGLPDNAGLADAANKALAIEDKIVGCYTLGAEQSGLLLADVPRNFKIVVRKRNSRLEKLKSLAQG